MGILGSALVRDTFLFRRIFPHVLVHVHDLDTMSNLLGKNEEDIRKGKALVAVSITEEQKSQIKQYDNDSSQVASSLEAMDAALDDLSSDVKELGRCLKQTTFATSQLQKVQAKIQSNIKNMLRGEKVKMELKEKNILSLDKKLRKIEKQQKKIIFGHMMYKNLRWLVLLLLLCFVVLATYTGINYDAAAAAPAAISPSPSSSPSPSPTPSHHAQSPSPSGSKNCTYVNCTCVLHPTN